MLSELPSTGAVGFIVAGLRSDRVPLLVPVLRLLVLCGTPTAFLALYVPVGKPGVTLVRNLTFLEAPPEKTLHVEL